MAIFNKTIFKINNMSVTIKKIDENNFLINQKPVWKNSNCKKCCKWHFSIAMTLEEIKIFNEYQNGLKPAK